jgi:hypothetical protein
MSKFLPGNNANPSGRPKTAYKENFDQLKAKKEMFDRGTQILNEKWDDIFYSMCDLAIKGNVQAANFVANYILGKPKETIQHDTVDNKSTISISISKTESEL